MAAPKQNSKHAKNKTPTYEDLALFLKVYEQKSLNKAASILGLPTSTASHVLSRLRSIFEDSLFLKTGIGVVPTPKADALYPSIVSLLQSMESLVRPKTLDLKKVRDHIKIACADNAPFMLFPSLIENILQAAPNVSLSLEPLSNKRLEDLRKKNLDFVISPMEGELPEGYYGIFLAVNSYSLVCGLNNPLVKREKEFPEGIPNEEISKYSFIDVLLDRTLLGVSTLRQWVAPEWSRYKSCLVTSYFLPCVPMIEHSELVSILPTYTAQLLAQRYQIKPLKTKAQLLRNKPRLIWHEVTNSDPLRQWIRSMIKSSIATGNELP